MKRRFLQITAFVFVALLLVRCSVENDNEVGCDDDDCISFCEELGLIGEGCDDEDRCVCIDRDGVPYSWVPDEVDTSSDSSSDSGL